MARQPAQHRLHGDRRDCAPPGFTPWRQRFKGVVAEGSIAGQKILALKPMTYMNTSGESRAGSGRVLQDAARGDHGVPRRTRPRPRQDPGQTRRRRGRPQRVAQHGPACWARRTTGACAWASAIPASRSAYRLCAGRFRQGGPGLAVAAAGRGGGRRRPAGAGQAGGIHDARRAAAHGTIR